MRSIMPKASRQLQASHLAVDNQQPSTSKGADCQTAVPSTDQILWSAASYESATAGMTFSPITSSGVIDATFGTMP
jgi:hypothetical protein